MWKELEFLFTDSHEDQKPIEDNSIGEIGLLPSQPPITSEVEDFGGSNAGKLINFSLESTLVSLISSVLSCNL
jgi:hypothetical protein